MQVLCRSCSVEPCRTVGAVNVPGSKSISNRVLLLAAMGKGQARINGLLLSDDTLVSTQRLFINSI